MSDNSGENDDSYKSSLEMGREDAIFSYNEHLRVFEEEANKAGRIAQLDGVILTVAVSLLLARVLFRRSRNRVSATLELLLSS